MSELKGFWSYVSDDDHAEHGRICLLATHLKEQYQMISGDTVKLFIARDSLRWGDNWRDEIKSNLASTAFFIPVLTTRYFTRPECLRELRSISQKASELGLKNIILPLLYSDVPALHEEKPTNEFIRIIQTLQWEDWREIRFSDLSSGDYRKAVVHLATRLFEANKQAERSSAPFSPPVTEDTVNIEDVSLGIVETMVAFEADLPKIGGTLEAIAKDINLIGEITHNATDETKHVDSLGKGFTPRLLIVQKLAKELSEPTERIYSNSNEYSSLLHSVDSGYRYIIEQIPAEIPKSPESIISCCKLISSVRSLSKSASSLEISFRGLIDTSKTLDKTSRALRPVGRRLRQGLTIMVESTPIINEWVRLIDSAGIDCEAESS